MRYKSEAAKTAQAIRKELKEKYPGLKMRINSETYAGGNSVRVVYLVETVEQLTIDKEIEDIVGKYQIGHFDGMIDLYEYSNSRDDIPQVKYVFVSREIVTPVFKQVIDGYNKYWNTSLEMYENESYDFKGVQIASLNQGTVEFGTVGHFHRFVEENYGDKKENNI